jgi:DNA-binding winged helix-turn-helix (wHTH) protein
MCVWEKMLQAAAGKVRTTLPPASGESNFRRMSVEGLGKKGSGMASITLSSATDLMGDLSTPQLTRKENELLRYLRDNSGKCVPREVLLHKVWGYREGVRSRTLDVHVQRLRRKLGPQEGSRILTVFRGGYLWSGEDGLAPNGHGVNTGKPMEQGKEARYQAATGRSVESEHLEGGGSCDPPPIVQYSTTT